MATTCKLIAKTTLGSTAANIEFTSIPATYDDLYLVASLRSNTAAGPSVDVSVRFNGAANDTNHSSRNIRGSGAAAISQNLAYCLIGFTGGTTTTASTFSTHEVYIPNYAGATNKSLSATSASETNATTAYIHGVAGLWSDTSAITAIKLLPGAGSFIADCTAYLFGITKA